MEEHMADSIPDDFIVGSGDYLKARGYKDPEEARAELLLANKIAVELETRSISQQEGARLTGLRQPDLSRIVNGNVRNYSVWRLMTILCELGHDVSIDIHPSANVKGGIVLRDGGAS
jgi:predicted XRE-type DNA-binding protein